MRACVRACVRVLVRVRVHECACICSEVLYAIVEHSQCHYITTHTCAIDVSYACYVAALMQHQQKITMSHVCVCMRACVRACL